MEGHMDDTYIQLEKEEEYLSENMIEESLEADEIAPWEAWFIQGWRLAL
jgi:hypothetical protein